MNLINLPIQEIYSKTLPYLEHHKFTGHLFVVWLHKQLELQCNNPEEVGHALISLWHKIMQPSIVLHVEACLAISEVVHCIEKVFKGGGMLWYGNIIGFLKILKGVKVELVLWDHEMTDHDQPPLAITIVMDLACVTGETASAGNKRTGVGIINL